LEPLGPKFSTVRSSSLLSSGLGVYSLVYQLLFDQHSSSPFSLMPIDVGSAQRSTNAPLPSGKQTSILVPNTALCSLYATNSGRKSPSSDARREIAAAAPARFNRVDIFIRDSPLPGRIYRAFSTQSPHLTRKFTVRHWETPLKDGWTLMVTPCGLGFCVAQVSYSNYNEVLLIFQLAT
jgi:hypothetical protein